MGDQVNKVRRRPVDALFGENESTPLPSYVVEPPQPVTTISKPSPSRPSISPPAEPPPVERLEPIETVERVEQDEPFETTEPIESYEPIGEPEPVDTSTPIDLSAAYPFPTEEALPDYVPSQPSPIVYDDRDIPPAAPEAPPPPAPQSDEQFAYLGDKIQRLYDQVSTELYDSPVVTEYCMKMLMQAREAFSRKDYATAEFYVETVVAKLKRSARSVQASQSFKMWIIWGWEFGMLGLSGIVIALTYIPSLTLFGLSASGDLAVLMRALGWGGIGGVIGALYNLPWFIQFREYDPAYNMSYIARPLQGMLIGGLLFLLSQAGILAGNTVIPAIGGLTEGSVSVGPVFLYLIAALAGFKQEYVYEFFDNLLKIIFRIPQVPNELKMPIPPSSSR